MARGAADDFVVALFTALLQVMQRQIIMHHPQLTLSKKLLFEQTYTKLTGFVLFFATPPGGDRAPHLQFKVIDYYNAIWLLIAPEHEATQP